MPAKMTVKMRPISWNKVIPAIGFVFSNSSSGETPDLLSFFLLPFPEIGFVFSNTFISDLELRISDFRPKAGFGFVFSNTFLLDTDPFGFAQDKLTPFNTVV